MHNEVPALSDLRSHMIEPLRGVFADARAQEISLLRPPHSTADDPIKLIYKSHDDRPLAVGLCSVPADPDFVARAVTRARFAREALDEETGWRVLTPLIEGRFRGLSFAFSAFCEPLSDARLLWPLQRRILAPTVLNWLRDVLSKTCKEPDEATRVREWLSPIRSMADDERLPHDLRREAALTAVQLEQGEWSPKQALAHNDLWKGNILIDRKPSKRHRSWAERFVIIDWAGSYVRGRPIYDLIRLGESFRLSPAQLRREMASHCRILSCATPFARAHLIAALAHLLLNLGHFPVDRFVLTARTCLAKLDAALR